MMGSLVVRRVIKRFIDIIDAFAGNIRCRILELRWRKSPFHWVQEQVDLLGLGLDLALLPAGVSIPGLSSIVGLVVKALLGGDFLKNGRLLGNLEDRVFGFIGGVSPAAVRISRIRRKIGGKY